MKINSVSNNFNTISKQNNFSFENNELGGQNNEINLNNDPKATLGRVAFKGNLSKGSESACSFVKKFLQIDNPIESAKLLMNRYPELSWLTGSVNATPEG